jgi:hypothetical protein
MRKTFGVLRQLVRIFRGRSGCETSISGQVLSGDEARLVTGQEEDGIGNLDPCPVASHRCQSGHRAQVGLAGVQFRLTRDATCRTSRIR